MNISTPASAGPLVHCRAGADKANAAEAFVRVALVRVVSRASFGPRIQTNVALLPLRTMVWRIETMIAGLRIVTKWHCLASLDE